MKSLITIIILAALAFGGYHLTQQQPDVLEEPTTTQALTMNARITTTEGVIELELFNELNQISIPELSSTELLRDL
jgi:hypothetical protein